MTPDWNDVLLRARLADAAYPTPGAKSPWADIERRVREEFGYTRFERFDAGGTQAFLCANGAELCFVFRGSDDLPDWVRNLKFVRRVELTGSAAGTVGCGDRDASFRGAKGDDALGRVHRGFLQAVRQVDIALVSRIREWRAERPGRVLHGVGHSLGAACAALTAIQHLHDCQPRLTLFGCPRIGNRRFAREFNFALGDRTLCIRNHNDIVTLSPFWNKTIGRQWYLAEDARAIDHPGWWFRAWQQAWANAKWAGNAVLRRLSNGRFGAPPTLLEQVSDHFMLNYVAAIERIALECGGPAPISLDAATRSQTSRSRRSGCA